MILINYTKPTRLSKTHHRLILVCLALVPIVIVLGYSLFVVVKYCAVKNGYSRAFSVIEVGMPEERVLEAFGSPTETTECGPGAKSVESCKKVLWYKVTLERWGVYLDNNHRVVGKVHNVLY